MPIRRIAGCADAFEMFAARKMQTAAKRDDEFIALLDGANRDAHPCDRASGFVGRALVSLDRGDRHRRKLCDLDLGQGVSV